MKLISELDEAEARRVSPSNLTWALIFKLEGKAGTCQTHSYVKLDARRAMCDARVLHLS